MIDPPLAIGFPLSGPDDPVEGWSRPSIPTAERGDES
jgi:hypothetical protein